MKLIIVFALIVVCVYADDDGECPAVGPPTQEILQDGQFPECTRSVTVRMNDPKAKAFAVVVYYGIRENSINTLIRAAKADKTFEFSVSFDKSSGFQITGINGRKSALDVLTSPRDSTVQTLFPAGMETLFPENGDTIIIERRKECFPLVREMIHFIFNNNFEDSSGVLGDEGVMVPNGDSITVAPKFRYIKDVSMEFVTNDAETLLAMFYPLDGEPKPVTVDITDSESVSISEFSGNAYQVALAPLGNVTIKKLTITVCAECFTVDRTMTNYIVNRSNEDASGILDDEGVTMPNGDTITVGLLEYSNIRDISMEYVSHGAQDISVLFVSPGGEHKSVTVEIEDSGSVSIPDYVVSVNEVVLTPHGSVTISKFTIKACVGESEYK